MLHGEAAQPHSVGELNVGHVPVSAGTIDVRVKHQRALQPPSGQTPQQGRGCCRQAACFARGPLPPLQTHQWMSSSRACAAEQLAASVCRCVRSWCLRGAGSSCGERAFCARCHRPLRLACRLMAADGCICSLSSAERSSILLKMSCACKRQTPARTAAACVGVVCAGRAAGLSHSSLTTPGLTDSTHLLVNVCVQPAAVPEVQRHVVDAAPDVMHGDAQLPRQHSQRVAVNACSGRLGGSAPGTQAKVGCTVTALLHACLQALLTCDDAAAQVCSCGCAVRALQ